MAKRQTPVVAGQFYPAQADELIKTVQQFLTLAQAAEQAAKAIIAPHAGYVYSGPIAASAYAGLAKRANTISHVVLLGPSHQHSFQGLASSSADYFLSPLGQVAVDHSAYAKLQHLTQVTEIDRAFTHEHSLEVHLPFLQVLLINFKLIPLVVGEADADSVAEVLEQLWGGPETLIVISSDLSHYHDYATAQSLDKITSACIEQGDYLAYEQACGRNAINGLLKLANTREYQIKTLDLRNSGDTAGDKGRVVGYGAYHLYT